MRRMSKSSHRAAVASRAVAMESLEVRRLLSDGPIINKIIADNRGEALLQVQSFFSEQIFITSNNAAQVFVAGPSGNPANSDHVQVPSTISYDQSSGNIIINANLPSASPYEVIVKSKDVFDQNNNHLDGEFNSDTTPSGNGSSGGNLRFVTAAYNDNHKIGIFNSNLGVLEVALIKKSEDPATISNFQRYANKGLWDGIFVNRSLLQTNPGTFGIVQAGNYNLANNGATVGVVSDLGDFTPSADGSNTAFTLAMGLNQNGQASNTFFFNTADNSSELDSGGYPVIGSVTTPLGDQILSTINAANTTDLSPLIDAPANPGKQETIEFSNVPYISAFRGKNYVYNNKAAELEFFNRVSIAMKVGAAIPTTPGAAAAAATAPVSPQSLAATGSIVTIMYYANSQGSNSGSLLLGNLNGSIFSGSDLTQILGGTVQSTTETEIVTST